jgi:predicted component of type VI protein secretion system
METESP